MIYHDLKNDKGQISLDYIIGVSLFIVAFFFLYNVLAGLLLPYQMNSEEVKPMADRVGTALVESMNGLGLAARDSDPNIIEITKVSQLNDSLSNIDAYNSVLNQYGLVTSEINYSMHVSLHYFNNTLYPNSSAPLLDGGPIPAANSNVGMSDRAVYLKKDSQILVMKVKVWL